MESYQDQEQWELNQEKVYYLEKVAWIRTVFINKNKKISYQINCMDKDHLLQMDLEEWEHFLLLVWWIIILDNWIIIIGLIKLKYVRNS